MPNHEVHKQAQQLARSYADEIEATRKEHWVDWLDNAEGKDIWTANKYVSGDPTDGGKTRIPTLNIKQQDGSFKSASSNDDKSSAFCEAFFPPPPADIGIDPDFDYPDPVTSFRPITAARVI